MSKLLIFALSLFVIFSCNKKEEFSHRSFYELGTLIEITLPLKNETIVKKINALIKNKKIDVISFQENLSNSKVNKKIPINNDEFYLLQQAKYFNNISNQHFDITMATITEKYGFPEGPFKIPANLKESESIAGFQNIIYTKNFVIKKTDLKIDMGAYAKGYIADKVIELLKNEKISNGIINAGGDLYALGTKNGDKWKIAVKHPDSNKKYLSIVALSNKALATSGNYERFFIKDGKRIIHIFDGITKKTANNYQSVSVIANNVETADGLATVYFLLNKKEISTLCKKLKTPVLIYTLDNKTEKMCDWQNYEVKQ